MLLLAVLDGVVEVDAVKVNEVLMDEGLALVDVLEVDVELVRVQDAFGMPRFSRSV